MRRSDSGMKYIFGIDITNDKNNKKTDGQVFHRNSSGLELKEEFEKYNSVIKNCYRQRTVLPLWMDTIKWISMASASFLSCCMIGASADSTLKTVYTNAPSIFYIVAALFTVSAALFLLEQQKKRYQTKDVYDCDKDYIRNVDICAKAVLHIPENAVIMEVFLFYYKVWHGRPKIVKTAQFPCRNYPVYAYVRNESLCLADFFDEWSIPFYCITGIKKRRKKAPIFLHKKQNLDGGALCIRWGEETYELLIPQYDMDKVSSLLAGYDIVSV